jgi:HSP20 family protein
MAIVRFEKNGDPFDFPVEFRRRFLQSLFPERDDNWRPMFDVSETKEDFRVKIEIPGINKDDVNIEIRDNILMVSGERKETKVTDEEELHIKEISYGKFSRSLKLPAKVNSENVTAKSVDGILHITLPKSESEKPKKIKIED